MILSLPAFGQTKISGKVTDEKGESIPGANISIKDSYEGTSSALDGTFSFVSDEKGSRTVVVTYVGYKNFERNFELTGSPVSFDASLHEEINQLEAVTITAGSFTAGDEKRRTILKAVDIATTAGATADIAGALNTLPGTTKVGESGRLFVRGGDGNETKTFIDGMVVLDAYSPAAPNTPSRGRFMPFMFKGVSFSTGGYSAEFGQALSSALVLNSKDKAELTQTDIGILSVGGDVAHTQVWDGSSLTGKIQYTNIRPYFGLINQRVDWNLPPASVEGSAAFRKEIGSDGILKLYGNYSHSNFSMYNHDIAHPESKKLFDLNNTFAYGNATYRQSLSPSWTLRGGLSYSYNENAVRLDSVPSNETEKGIHTKIVAEHSFSDRLEFRAGSEAIVRDYVAWKRDEKSPAILTQSFNEVVHSNFAEVEAYASKRFVAKAGGRMEFNSMRGEVSIDPRFSVAYKPGPIAGQFSFAYGIFRQSAKNQYLRVNHALNTEKSEHFILNYQIISSNRTFRIEAYYKKYADLVKYQNGDPTSLVSSGSGYAKGVELFWRDNKSLRNVDYWVSYSYLDTRREYLNYPYAAIPNFASEHNFSVVYKHFVSAIKSQIGLTYSFASGRTYYNPNSEKFNGGRTPAYHDFSANISYLPKNWLIIYLSCTNLLGRDNIFGYTYASTPDANGVYASQPIHQPAARFVFLGVFITISKNKSVNQLPNL